MSIRDFVGRAAFRFRLKLHSQAESWSLLSLDMGRAVGYESLNIPKMAEKVWTCVAYVWKNQILVAQSFAVIYEQSGLISISNQNTIKTR